MSFERLCERRGKTLDKAIGCVVGRDGDIWTINTSHDAYPRDPPSHPPGVLRQASNFAAAAVNHIAAGMPMCSDEEIKRRHDICLACEFFKDDACTQCGCPLSRTFGYVSKLSWADQECPVGKWGKATSGGENTAQPAPPEEGGPEGRMNLTP